MDSEWERRGLGSPALVTTRDKEFVGEGQQLKVSVGTEIHDGYQCPKV